MKILTLLNEGLIKVPQEVTNEVMRAIAPSVFSYFITFHTNEGNEDSVKNLQTLQKVYERKYGGFSLLELNDDLMHNGFETEYIVYIDPSLFDSRYRKTKQTRKYPVIVTSGVNLGSANTLASYHLNKNNKVNLTVDILENDYFTVLLGPTGVRYLKVFMQIVEHAVEHELMHFVQNKLLGQDIMTKAASYYDRDGNTDLEKYYQSDIEFGPSIKSTFAQFLGDITAASKDGIFLNKNDLDREIKSFVQPGASSGKIQGLSNFFNILYKTDKIKWKKAVKLFHGLVNDNINSLILR